MNSKNLAWLKGTSSFYRELGVGLLDRIHSHHGGCMELMEKIEKVERITGNPPHILGMANRGLIIEPLKSFLLN